LRSGWLFAFPNEHVTEPEMEIYERAGIEASEIAARLELWDLASGALDLAGASRCSVGRYGAAKALHDLRRTVMPRVTNVMEIGDFHSVGIWIDVELGRYQDAIRRGTEALAAIGGRGPNVEIHTRAWLATALWLTGRWDESLDETAAVKELLGDQRDDPPYFAMHTFGAAAMIHQARGQEAEARRLRDTMANAASLSSGRTYPYLVRMLTERGELDRAWTVERPWNWRVHYTDALFAEAQRAAASARWDLVPELMTAMREQADLGPAPLLVPAADRLAGRAALAAGEDATDLLGVAADGFDAIGVPHERARTNLFLAEACRAVGRIDDAADALARAAITFEELGAVADLERIRRLG
jgi:tetratricopeptide (TPR) repeat protein